MRPTLRLQSVGVRVDFKADDRDFLCAQLDGDDRQKYFHVRHGTKDFFAFQISPHFLNFAWRHSHGVDLISCESGEIGVDSVGLAIFALLGREMILLLLV